MWSILTDERLSWPLTFQFLAASAISESQFQTLFLQMGLEQKLKLINIKISKLSKNII